MKKLRILYCNYTFDRLVDPFKNADGCENFAGAHDRLAQFAERLKDRSHWFRQAEKLGATVDLTDAGWIYLSGNNPALKKLGFERDLSRP